MSRRIETHDELDVYQRAFSAAMEVFALSKQFPQPERYALTDQIRRSSRSVCANLAEAWRKRRYLGAFVSKLSDVEGEAAETQVWLQFAGKCGYVAPEVAARLHHIYDGIIRTVVGMITHPETWVLRGRGPNDAVPRQQRDNLVG